MLTEFGGSALSTPRAAGGRHRPRRSLINQGVTSMTATEAGARRGVKRRSPACQHIDGAPDDDPADADRQSRQRQHHAVATQLNSLQTQLQTAYQLTAQLQKLSLAQYLPTDTLGTPMYEFSYNEVIEESPQVMRAHERRAMDRVIDMLRAARAGAATSREAIEALYYLRRLWAIFLDDLRNPENELPEQLRAGIVSIGIWMNKEIDRVARRSNERSDPDDRNQRDHSRRAEVRAHEHHASRRGATLHQRRGHSRRPQGDDRVAERCRRSCWKTTSCRRNRRRRRCARSISSVQVMLMDPARRHGALSRPLIDAALQAFENAADHRGPEDDLGADRPLAQFRGAEGAARAVPARREREMFPDGKPSSRNAA